MSKIIVESLVNALPLETNIRGIAAKIIDNSRITTDDCLKLYNYQDISLLGALANYVNEQKNGKRVFFNRNFHIEPSNICKYKCKFCSYRREAHEGYAMTQEQIIEEFKKHYRPEITEVHIVGSAHPERGIEFFEPVLRQIKAIAPTIHIKAFSAVEVLNMLEISGLSMKEGLTRLKEAGLDSLPGGGAEIFSEEIRPQICNDKATADFWLELHHTAHELGIPSNATMLYGHIENYAHRVDHLHRLRELQDKTNGFNAFIPLKFLSKHNELSSINQVSIIEDMKNFAVSRIFLDNMPHIKSYWPMLGKEEATLSLYFGADDMDGTIDDTTTIYTTAGSKEQSPLMATDEIVNIIQKNGRVAVERDSVYNVIRSY